MTPGNDPRPRDSIGAGAPIALLLIVGVVVGGFLGQPSIGLLAGLVLGLGVAALTWKMRK